MECFLNFVSIEVDSTVRLNIWLIMWLMLVTNDAWYCVNHIMDYMHILKVGPTPIWIKVGDIPLKRRVHFKMFKFKINQPTVEF